MSNETTPLISTVRVAPPRRRYQNHVIRRFCTIAFSSSLIALLILFLLPGSLLPWHQPRPLAPGDHRSSITWKELQDILLNTPSGEKAAEWSKYYTSGPHLAGKNYSQAEWTKERWEEMGIESHIVSYDVYLNYPRGDHPTQLRLYDTNGKDEEDWELKYEPTLQEDVLEEDETTGLEDRIPAFHAYSANGNVTAPFVYVNYGSIHDYADLVAANVSLEGKIAIARYGQIFRGLKVKRAQELGMVGVVLFTDPGDDGDLTEENGHEPYPNGGARNPSAIQRGSVQFLSFAAGDPTTPGYPSLPGAPRVPVDYANPSIPSVPISYSEVIPILECLNGHGLAPKDFNERWDYHLGLKYKGVEYNVGPTPDNTVLNLVNQQDYTITPIWNVIGIINGTLPDEVVIFGNHRDAWVAGGAGDPHSGTANMMEVARAFGMALSEGWTPLRTIVFASWDGEEYAQIGSTEWVEQYLPWLQDTNIVYINADVSISRHDITTQGHPLLYNLLDEVLQLVPSPDPSKGETVRDLWDGHMRVTGSGSDFTAFQDHAGIPSLEVGFGMDPSTVAGESDVVYQYHSNYDSFHWMSTVCDPGFRYHEAIAKVYALLLGKLSESPIIAMNATYYAMKLDDYLSEIESAIKSSSTPFSAAEEKEDKSSALLKTLKPLHKAITHFHHTAFKHDKRAASLAGEAGEDIPWWKWYSKLRLIFEIRKINDKYKKLDRQFLHPEGLDNGREWFKHVVYAPGMWTGYSGKAFPGLTEAVEDGDFERAVKWVGILRERIEAATRLLGK